MSELLNSGRVGVLDKDRTSNEDIYYRWCNSGLLEGLDRDASFRVSLAMEIAANFMLMEHKSCDIMHDITGVNFHGNGRFETVVFAIISRIVRRTLEAMDFIPEIINDAKKEYNTPLAKAVHDGAERHLEYFYNNVLKKWSKYHSGYKDFEEYKKSVYNEYVERYRFEQTAAPFDITRCVDWEAEFCAALAEKIEREIIEKIKKDETN